MRKKNLTKIKSAGFTLVELLVTLSIFAITTGIVMTSQGKFDNSVLLTNTAYDIAITLRQAQAFGVNVRETETITTGNKFNSSYGVYFNKITGGNQRFVMFFDENNDRKISDTGITCPKNDSECVNAYKIKRGHRISDICVVYSNDSSCIPKDYLNVSFKRPNPEAVILADGESYSVNNPNPTVLVKITVSSSDGTATRSIIVTKVGQIYVKNN